MGESAKPVNYGCDRFGAALVEPHVMKSSIILLDPRPVRARAGRNNNDNATVRPGRVLF